MGPTKSKCPNGKMALVANADSCIKSDCGLHSKREKSTALTNGDKRSSSDSATVRSTALPRRSAKRNDDDDRDGEEFTAVDELAALLAILRRRPAGGSHENAWRGDMRGDGAALTEESGDGDADKVGEGTQDIGELNDVCRAETCPRRVCIVGMI